MQFAERVGVPVSMNNNTTKLEEIEPGHFLLLIHNSKVIIFKKLPLINPVG